MTALWFRCFLCLSISSLLWLLRLSLMSTNVHLFLLLEFIGQTHKRNSFLILSAISCCFFKNSRERKESLHSTEKRDCEEISSRGERQEKESEKRPSTEGAIRIREEGENKGACARETNWICTIIERELRSERTETRETKQIKTLPQSSILI